MERFNPTQSLGQIPVCSTMEEVNAVLETILDAMQRNGIAPRPVNPNVAVQVDADGNRKYPSSNAARNWFPFQLTSVFTDGAAEALVLGPDGVPIVPNEQVQVVDYLGIYSAGAVDDVGLAMPAESTIPGKFQNQIWVMPEVGVPTGTDTGQVRITNGLDDMEYLEAKFAGLDGVAEDIGGDHQEVYITVEAGPPHRLRMYTDVGVGGADSDEQVKVDAADPAAGYLEDKLYPPTSTEYDSTVHNIVRWIPFEVDTDVWAMIGYTLNTAESGKVRVSSGDSLAYLADQFPTNGAYTGTGQTEVTFDISTGTVIRGWIATPSDNLVKVNVFDTSGYLEDQFSNTDAYDEEIDLLVYSETIDDGGGDKQIKLFSRSAMLLGIASGDITAAVEVGDDIEPGSGTITAYVYDSGALGSSTYSEADEGIVVENWAQHVIADGTPVLAGRNAVGTPFLWPLAIPLMFGVTAETIPAATLSGSEIIPGEGDVQVYIRDLAGADGWVASGSPFNAFNNYFDPIPEGTPVYYTDVLGQRTIVNAGCTAVG